MTMAPLGQRGALRIDPLELGLAADPYPAYARMRATGTLVSAGPGTYAVTRHADVTTLLTDRRLSHRFPDSYRSFAVGSGPVCDLLQRIVSSQEPPGHGGVHARLHATLDRAWSGAWWRWAENRITAIVRAGIVRGRFDAVTDLAAPLAVDLVSSLYGLEHGRRTRVAADAPVLGRALTALRLSAEDRADADAAVLRSRALFGATTGPGLLGELVDPTVPAAVDNAVFLCFTAIEMITAAVSTCITVLLDHPGEMARLRADPELLRTAAAELLRFDSPTQGTLRRVTAPLDVGGQKVRPGRVLLLLLGAANHDETVFHEPGRLDVGRADNPHLSFGAGPYRCIGARLATAVCTTVLRALLARTARLERGGPARRHDPATFSRSYARIAVSAWPA